MSRRERERDGRDSHSKRFHSRSEREHRSDRDSRPDRGPRLSFPSLAHCFDCLMLVYLFCFLNAL